MDTGGRDTDSESDGDSDSQDDNERDEEADRHDDREVERDRSEKHTGVCLIKKNNLVKNRAPPDYF